MRRETFKYLEQVLQDYPKFDKYIKKREDALLYRFNELTDENVGGGRALNKKNDAVERQAITIAEDKCIFNLKMNKLAVERTINKFDEETNCIISEMYFNHYRRYTNVRDASDILHISYSTINRKRKLFFEELATEIGLL